MQWEIKNATIISPDTILPGGGLLIKDNSIEAVLKKVQSGRSEIQLDLDGLLVFPGLIDAHDHLLGTYLPRVGDNRPYLNWLPWDNDLKASPIYAERQQLDAEQLYYMGAYRHLINGVTAVSDHIPHFVQDPYVDRLPIRVVTQFAMAHSICSYSLTWGKSVEEEYQEAVEKNIPFITHCSEGFDDESRQAVSVLQRKDCLGPHTLLIHGIAFSKADIELLASKKVNVAWCPASNLYMFNSTTDIKGLLKAGVNVSLGTDSPMSGSVNMFDELQTAKRYYEETYAEELSDELLVKMVTVNPAKALFLNDKLGSLASGKLADFMVMDGRYSDPYKSLVQGKLQDIKLVVIDGKPCYGDKMFQELFTALSVPAYNVNIAGREMIACQDIDKLFRSVQSSVGFKKELDYLPVGYPDDQDE